MDADQIWRIFGAFILLWTAALIIRGHFYERVIQKLDRERFEFARIAAALERIAKEKEQDAKP